MLSGGNRSAWRELGLLFALSLPVLFWGIQSIGFLDPDEGMYGAIAREMAEGGDWVTPRFNGVRYLEKPPLYFWLSAFTMKLFGPSEWAVRIWNAIPALVSVLLTWRIGCWLYGQAGGLLAGIVLATNVGYFLYVRKASTDFLFVFALTLTLYGFARSVLRRKPGGGGGVVFFVGAALAVLAKGVIGLVLPILIVGLYLWRQRGAGDLSCLNLRWGIPAFLAIVLPWHLLAAVRNPRFVSFYILDNQILRFLNRRAFLEDDVSMGTVAFLLVTAIWFFPWSLCLPASLSQGFPRRPATLPPTERLRALVGFWAVVVVGFFALSGSKLEYYALPAFPALALMVGGRWGEALRRPDSGTGLARWLAVAAVGGGMVGLAAVIGSRALNPKLVHAGLAELNVYYRILKAHGLPFPFPSVEPFATLLFWLGLALLVGLPGAFALFHLRGPRASFAALVGLAGVVAILVFQLLLLVEPHHSSKALAQAVSSRVGERDLLAHEGSLEYSAGLPFYTGRRIRVVNGQRGDLDFGSRLPEADGYFLDGPQLGALWKGASRVFLVVPWPTERSVLTSLAPARVHLLGQYGSRRLYSNRGD